MQVPGPVVYALVAVAALGTLAGGSATGVLGGLLAIPFMLFLSGGLAVAFLVPALPRGGRAARLLGPALLAWTAGLAGGMIASAGLRGGEGAYLLATFGGAGLALGLALYALPVGRDDLRPPALALAVGLVFVALPTLQPHVFAASFLLQLGAVYVLALARAGPGGGRRAARVAGGLVGTMLAALLLVRVLAPGGMSLDGETGSVLMLGLLAAPLVPAVWIALRPRPASPAGAAAAG